MTAGFFYSPDHPSETATLGSVPTDARHAKSGRVTDSIVGFRIFQNVLDATFAGELNIVASATAKASKLIIDYEAIMISPTFEEFVDDRGNRLRRWYARGVRVALAVGSYEANLSVNAGTVALAAQAGLATASMEAIALGLGSTGFPSELPPPFDDLEGPTALAKIGEAVTAAFAWLSDESERPDGAVVIPGEMVEVLEHLGHEAAGNPMTEARSMLLAAERVQAGQPLKDALDAAKNADPPVDSEIVEATYEALLGVRILDEKPDKAARTRARDWLRKTA